MCYIYFFFPNAKFNILKQYLRSRYCLKIAHSVVYPKPEVMLTLIHALILTLIYILLSILLLIAFSCRRVLTKYQISNLNLDWVGGGSKLKLPNMGLKNKKLDLPPLNLRQNNALFHEFLTIYYNYPPNIRDRQPMVRASVTERWVQLQTGNNILLSQTFYTKIIV